MSRKPKKAKKMTVREKAFRAEIKKELQQEGRLPPDKPRLNRKKFAKEVVAEYEQMKGIDDFFYLKKAIGCMVSPDMRDVTSEQVGVLKALKIAVLTKKFEEAIKTEGRMQYTIGEYIEKVVLPIIKL
jgi:hypothetical protein